MNRPIARILPKGLLAAAVLGGCLYLPPKAEADGIEVMDTIRVGLFITVPNKYTLTIPAATFSSDGGLAVGVSQGGAPKPLTAVVGGATARVAVENYSVLLGENSSFTAALAVFKAVQTAGGNAVLEAVDRGGSTSYQVSEGSYSSAAAAGTALAKWNANATVKAFGGGASVRGPLHLETAAYASEQEARLAMASFSASGTDTFLVLRPSDSGVRYSVMVGAAADSASLEAVKLKLAGIAEAAGLKQAAAGDYLLQRRDLSVSQKEGTAGMLLTFPAGTKAVVQPSSTQGVKLAERYARTYRGQFELSSYNNALAVINELPFEQYLYSVVGGEMPGSWPIEALKAQAVAARSYAVYQGTGFGIAQVVDTTLSQAYNGVASEKAATVKAVDDTKGLVMLSGGKPVEAVFSSSAGGYTADPSEVWGSQVPYLAPVQSPDDASENGLYKWYRVMAPSGGAGFIRSDTADLTGEKNAAGAAIARIKSAATNVRPLPLIQDGVAPVDKLDAGAKVTVLETVAQSNEFNWMRGPFTSAMLLDSMKGKTTSAVSGPIQSLEVASRGPSGRVMQVNVNGKAVPVKYPDSLRTVMGSLPSTRFAIEPAGQVSLLGAGGASAVKETGAAVQVLGAGGAKASPSGGAGLAVMNASGAIRPVSASQTWLIRGTGNGHGLGMSQYGAKSLADSGYDYQRILKYYYKEIELAKDGS